MRYLCDQSPPVVVLHLIPLANHAANESSSDLLGLDGCVTLPADVATGKSLEQIKYAPLGGIEMAEKQYKKSMTGAHT